MPLGVIAEFNENEKIRRKNELGTNYRVGNCRAFGGVKRRISRGGELSADSVFLLCGGNHSGR